MFLQPHYCSFFMQYLMDQKSPWFFKTTKHKNAEVHFCCFFYKSTYMVRTRRPRRNFCVLLRHNALIASWVNNMHFYVRIFKLYHFLKCMGSYNRVVWTSRDHVWLPCIYCLFWLEYGLENEVWTWYLLFMIELPSLSI